MNLDRSILEEALEKFHHLQVVVIGDLMLDRYLWGRVERISPEAPVPVVEVTEDAERPGGAGNVALNLLSLGAMVRPVGLVGDDAHGKTLMQLLDEKGAHMEGVLIDNERPTTVKTRVIAEDQQVVRVDREKNVPLSNGIEATLISRLRGLVSRADAVILQDYNKGVMTPRLIRAAIDFAKEEDVPVTVDPKSQHFFEFYGATLFKPNLREAEGALNRSLRSEKDIEAAGNEMLFRLQAKQVLITRGGEGMSLFEENRPTIHIPTRARTISDVSGAGDTVISTLTLGIAAGYDAFTAAQLANRAAGWVVSQVGVVPITPEALLNETGD
ncbi:MAG TPA: D-glycero-beta-D-manno-heptose-7-phosphate kinase [Bacteroidetes bacterium]|nr:D-glycero-beta-D-manno-heptose-7-phosphate kinase [Bacteroidota bacterium]